MVSYWGSVSDFRQTFPEMKQKSSKRRKKVNMSENLTKIINVI